ncbi:ABC transporter substrate-binding protein [Jeotgalibacillus proteolyticus]|uniref:Spermidine/putrescine ABC transporter substrate-binding protein n=1 Tax=Jeotgalibacillus proteolyticus TaxID=2082395 RepID=A0A2S5GCN8_9BACL|nr:ABC transporter substrate-binding protein [Jeotgalibacillus proteolyticus]PPA70663.1 spermidine/putrescine ABC transporter substrate-binding protein [Jeotgalibacillus proteolyticus]
MKRLTTAFIVVVVASASLIFLANHLNASQGMGGSGTITVFNWGDYIDDELIDQFEEETGIRVVYETFDSNEAMLAKIQQGGTSYDIAVPSEYTIAKMAEDDLLIELNHDQLPNMTHLNPDFMDLSFDPGNKYSIPYFWGTVGIVYNTEMIDDIDFTSWDDLWSEELKNDILLVDGAREIMGMSLNSLGYSLNTLDRAELQEAKAKLQTLSPNIKAIVGDEIKMLIGNGEAPVGVVWSGEAADIMYENEALDYAVPEEGSNLWFDNMVIPRTADNIEGAHAFINFMLDPENAAQNAEYVGYSTPNLSAFELLPEEVSGDERFYPAPELTDRLEVYDNLGREMLAYYNELFLEFKIDLR